MFDPKAPPSFLFVWWIEPTVPMANQFTFDPTEIPFLKTKNGFTIEGAPFLGRLKCNQTILFLSPKMLLQMKSTARTFENSLKNRYGSSRVEELWPIGNGRRLMSTRSWARILVPHSRCIIFTLFVVKIMSMKTSKLMTNLSCIL